MTHGSYDPPELCGSAPPHTRRNPYFTEGRLDSLGYVPIRDELSVIVPRPDPLADDAARWQRESLDRAAHSYHDHHFDRFSQSYMGPLPFTAPDFGLPGLGGM